MSYSIVISPTTLSINVSFIGWNDNTKQQYFDYLLKFNIVLLRGRLNIVLNVTTLPLS